MGLPKPSTTSSSGSKLLPKRFAAVYKFGIESSTPQQQPSDSLLQSSNKRRRYQRRGSRAPTMFGMVHLHVIEDLDNAREEEVTTTTRGRRHQRKLSTMSNLVQALEETDILGASSSSLNSEASLGSSLSQ